MVLETDNGLSHLPLCAVTSPGPLEMPFAFRAVGTGEPGTMRPQVRIRVATLFAKGWLNPLRLRLHAFRPGKDQVKGAFDPIPCAGSGESEG